MRYFETLELEELESAAYGYAAQAREEERKRVQRRTRRRRMHRAPGAKPYPLRTPRWQQYFTEV